MKTIKVKDLMAISGKGGLFRFLAQARNGVVVESLEDKKRAVVPTTARISALDDISIFAKEEDIPLSDVLLRIHEKEEGKPAIDPKSESVILKKYFLEVLPDYNEDRVYVSDIKKVLTWYNLLHKYGILEIVEKEAKENAEEETPEKDAEGAKE